MSLLKLKTIKTKSEPLHISKNIKNYDNKIKEEILEPIKLSSLIIGEGATIKGEIKEENEIRTTNKDFHTVQALVQYNKPLYFDDEIEIGLKIKEVGNTSLTWIMGMFMKKTGELASATEIVHVYTDMKTGKPTTITDDLKKKLGVA